MVRPRLIDLTPDELCQGLHHYLFIVNLGRCDIFYNSISYRYARACVPNKVKNINVKLFNMIPDVNESKTLIKHISCDSRYKFDGRIEYKEPLKIMYTKTIMSETLAYVPLSTIKSLDLMNI